MINYSRFVGISGLSLIAALVVAAGCGAGDGSGSGDGDGVGDGDGDLGDGDLSTGGAAMGDGDGVATGGTTNPAGGGPGSGGGTPGAGGSGGPSGTLFSEDFDALAAGPIEKNGTTWTHLFEEWDEAGVASVVTDKVRSAPNAAYVKKGSANQGWLQLVDSSVFPFTGDKIHVRAYINISEWPGSHTSWMEIGASTNEQSEYRFGANSSKLEVNHYPSDAETVADGVTMTPGTWHCVEWAYDKVANSLEVWLDDTKIEALNVVNGVFGNQSGISQPAPPIEAVRFGAEINTNEAWFDDIVVSTELIGCE